MKSRQSLVRTPLDSVSWRKCQSAHSRQSPSSTSVSSRCLDLPCQLPQPLIWGCTRTDPSPHLQRSLLGRVPSVHDFHSYFHQPRSKTETHLATSRLSSSFPGTHQGTCPISIPRRLITPRETGNILARLPWLEGDR